MNDYKIGTPIVDTLSGQRERQKEIDTGTPYALRVPCFECGKMHRWLEMHVGAFPFTFLCSEHRQP